MGNPFVRKPQYLRATFDLEQQTASRSAHDKSLHGNLSDPHNSGAWQVTDPESSGVFRLGRIIYAMPYVGWYRVLLEHDGERDCCKVSNDAGQMSPGSRETAPLSAGDMVFVFRHDRSRWGYILGTVPENVQSGALVYPDMVSQGGSSGFHRERYYHELLSVLKSEGGIKDFSNSRPLDSTSLDWGRVSDLGGMLHMDPFMAFLRMSETCGLSLFYMDQLARLSGYNLDIRSALHEEQFRDDEGESSYYRGEALYPYEALGIINPAATGFVRNEGKDVVVGSKSFYSTLEPLHDDQMPFHRYREWGAYVGRGRIREMVAPPANVETFRLSEGKDEGVVLTGLFREHIHPTGDYSLQSARSITFAKRGFIPVAKQKRAVEDPLGDNATNYKAGNRLGEGASHDSQALQVTETEGVDIPEGVTKATGIDQRLAYDFNKRDLGGFVDHLKDFEVPEEEDLTEVYNAWVPPLDQLVNQQWVESPPVEEVPIDSTYGNAKIAAITSLISIEDDGSVIIGNGYGSRITLSNGGINIDTPGDLTFTVGRRLVSFVGDDVIIKANNSVDVTSSNKDIRIKADGNVQLLSANAGVLVESQGDGGDQKYQDKVGEEIESTGIVLKSAKSHVAMLGSDVYVRSGVASDSGNSSGNIVLDANQGKSELSILASTINQLVEDAVYTIFGVTSPRAANRTQESGTYLNGTLNVSESVDVQGSMTCASGITVTEGHIATSGAGTDGKVDKLKSNTSQQRLDREARIFEQVLKKNGVEAFTKIRSEYLAVGKLGNEELQKDLGFSFRNEDQYGTKDYKIIQTVWQKLAEDGNLNLSTWQEKDVEYQGTKYMPFPGKKAWSEDSIFCKLRSVLFDYATGTSKPRTNDEYQAHEYGQWETAKASTEFKVLGE